MSWRLEDLSYESTCSAVEANLFETLASFDRWPHCEVHRDEDMLWYVSDIPHPLFNGVLDARIGAEGVEKRVEETVARFQARGVPMMWWIGPSTRPDRLGEVLLAHGMSYRRNPAGMAIDLSRADEGLVVPPGLSIRSVDTLHDLENWITAFAAGFGMPDFWAEALLDCFRTLGLKLPWRHFLGFLDGEPVGVSSVFIGAGVAGIYNVSTVPRLRRQGIGSALTLAALKWGRTLGYRAGILQASAIGEGVYRRIGFEERCRFSTYLLSPA